MNLTDTNLIKVMAGCPIFFEDICAIYPATLEEIAKVGYNNFMNYLNVIMMKRPDFRTIKETKETPDEESKEITKEFVDFIETLTDFEYLLMTTNIDIKTNQLLREAFRFFIHENVTFSLDPAQIIIGPIEEKHLLNEENFYNFRETISKMHFLSEEEDIEINEDDPPQVVALKLQMIKNRERVAKAKSKKKGKNKLLFSDLIASLATGSYGYNLINIWNLTYYAFQDQLKRMGWYEEYNMNTRAALAGAKIKKSELKYWMKAMIDKE